MSRARGAQCRWRHMSRRKVNSLNPFLQAVVRVPLSPQLSLLPFWPAKTFCPSSALTAGAKEKFLQERVGSTFLDQVGVTLPGKSPSKISREANPVHVYAESLCP